MTAVVAIGAFLFGSASLALSFWALRWTRSKSNELRKLDSRIDELEDALDDRDRAIEQLENDLGRAKSSLAAAEEHRDTLLEELARAGDSRGVAAGIRADLHRLSKMSEANDPAAEDR